MKVASIDIGTNTVRCLLAEWRGGRLYRQKILRDITRLGEGLRVTGRLSQGAEERTLVSLVRFGDAIRGWDASRVRAVATSATRDAGTPDLQEKMEQSLGLPVEVISGQEEARLSALGMLGGVTESRRKGKKGNDPGEPLEGITLDIGGGSTEVVRVKGEEILWWTSLPEGVVHLTEAYLIHDPPLAGEVSELRGRVEGLLQPLPPDGGKALIATAGTPTTLAALDLSLDDYDPALVNGHQLSAPRLDQLVERLQGIPAVGRLALPGMEPGREDIIVAGSLFLQGVVRRWGFPTVWVSDWGLLEGIALGLIPERR